MVDDLLLLRHAEGRGGLVHDEELRVPVDGAGDGHGLALAAGERPDAVAQGRDEDVELFQHLAAFLLHVRGPGPRADAGSGRGCPRAASAGARGTPPGIAGAGPHEGS